MLALTTVVATLFLCLNAIASHEFLMPDTVKDSTCLTKTLSKVIKDDEFLVISSSGHNRIGNILENEIWQVLTDKMVLNIDTRPQNANRHSKRTPSTAILLTSSMDDIVDAVSSLRGTDAWNAMRNAATLIVTHMSGTEHNRTMLTVPFVKEVSVHFNVPHIRIIYEFYNDYALVPHKNRSCSEVELTSESMCGRVHEKSSVNNAKSECTIRTAVLPYAPYSFHSNEMGFTKGIEIDLVKELASWSHFNLEMEVIGDAAFMQTYGNFDIIVGASNQMLTNATKSIDFEFDDLTWCVKRADVHPPWRNFFLICTWKVWTICTVGLFVTAVTLYAFYYHYRPETYLYCIGVTMMTIFALPVPYSPTHGVARIHFGILLIYGLLAVILINSYLMSFLTQPRLQYQIHTVDELMHENYKILIDENLISLRHLGHDNVSSYVKQNYELCQGMAVCLSQLLEQSNVATIVTRKFAEYFEAQSNSPIFCFARSETFNRVTRSLTFISSNSNMLNKTNSFIRQAMETGHLQKWEVTGDGRKEYEENWADPVAFTIGHISGALMVYTVGTSAAVLLYIFEMLAFKRIQKKDVGRFWKFMDKYVLSPDRLYWNKSSCDRDQFDLGRTQYIP